MHRTAPHNKNDLTQNVSCAKLRNWSRSLIRFRFNGQGGAAEQLHRCVLSWGGKRIKFSYNSLCDLMSCRCSMLRSTFLNCLDKVWFSIFHPCNMILKSREPADPLPASGSCSLWLLTINVLLFLSRRPFYKPIFVSDYIK